MSNDSYKDMHINPFWILLSSNKERKKRFCLPNSVNGGYQMTIYDLGFSQKRILRLWPSAMRWHTVWYLVTNFSEQLAVSIFRVEKVSLSQGHCLPSDHTQPCPSPHLPVMHIILLLGSLLLPWRWRPKVPSKTFIVMYQTAQRHIPKDWSLNELTFFCTSVKI